VAERVFAGKLERAGFVDVEIFGHQVYGIEEISLYPLFTPDVIDLLRRSLPVERQCNLATSVIVRGKRPGDG